jgi:hypothetical protein
MFKGATVIEDRSTHERYFPLKRSHVAIWCNAEQKEYLEYQDTVQRGGYRASMYNALPESVQVLADVQWKH